MRTRPIAVSLNLFAGLLLAVAATSSHGMWQWMRGAALADFQDSDWVLLKATARDVLDNKPDGEQVNWTNPATGNRGSIIAIETFSHDGKQCRRAAMRNISASGKQGQASYNLCQQNDGDWIYVSASVLRPPAKPTAQAATPTVPDPSN